MKRALKRIAIVLLILVMLVVVIGLALPTQYEVSRSIVIQAPRERVHALIADLSNWPQWEPWTEEDPTIKTTTGESTTGLGAHQSWVGSEGNGNLTFTRVDAQRGIEYALMFDDKYECVAGMTHEPAGDAVRVTWWMTGDTETPVIGGYFAKLMPRMISPMFDRGLEKLKAAAEAAPESTE